MRRAKPGWNYIIFAQFSPECHPGFTNDFWVKSKGNVGENRLKMSFIHFHTVFTLFPPSSHSEFLGENRVKIGRNWETTQSAHTHETRTQDPRKSCKHTYKTYTHTHTQTNKQTHTHTRYATQDTQTHTYKQHTVYTEDTATRQAQHETNTHTRQAPIRTHTTYKTHTNRVGK